MSWQPEEHTLQQLAQCLKDSLGGHDANARKNAEIVCPPHMHLVKSSCADFGGFADAQDRQGFA
jgi:hypothetical protein